MLKEVWQEYLSPRSGDLPCTTEEAGVPSLSSLLLSILAQSKLCVLQVLFMKLCALV